MEGENPMEGEVAGQAVERGDKDRPMGVRKKRQRSNSPIARPSTQRSFPLLKKLPLTGPVTACATIRPCAVNGVAVRGGSAASI